MKAFFSLIICGEITDSHPQHPRCYRFKSTPEPPSSSHRIVLTQAYWHSDAGIYPSIRETQLMAIMTNNPMIVLLKFISLKNRIVSRNQQYRRYFCPFNRDLYD
jgi:hypothetical protein